ncbi:hypothetical protein KP509_37G069200 [Ceratopteris richardii]|uniref:Mic1 domain-containing protein n=3 Tax=Ceratopteris richardii TaxID=49495 RepID=A0A8T2QB71_CERRI|nr:hypothetical protein KP509_37G069200 [Ceratopteris richardii]KAH7280472.1 hypothetical protein KP509_37G069200 [Ceratopteris richardii]
MKVDVIRNTMASSSSSSQFVRRNIAGSGALSHVYIQYPPFRFNVPDSSRMIYDDGSRSLLVPSGNKMFSWPVTWQSHSDTPNIIILENSHVLTARFSLDGKILAVQNSDYEVSFYNRESGVKFKHPSRSHTERILGLFWTDCPACDVIFVTTGGLELFALAPKLDAVKLVDVKPSQVSWYSYTHESRLVLLASGMQCKTFLCYQFSAGGIIRLPKFDASMRKVDETSKAAALTPKDVHIATMYGRVYCLQVDRLAMELNVYRFYRDAVVPQGTLPIYSDTVAFSVVDGVLLVHQLASKVVLLYDIFADLNTPISAPLPLLIRRDIAFTAVGTSEDSDISSHTESKKLGSTESNIYGDSWNFANPDIILDQENGILWKIHLDLEALAASSSNVPSLLAFLQRRKLDALLAKQLSMTVLHAIIIERRPLSLISEAMDVVNKSYSQFLRTRAASTITRQQATRSQVSASGNQPAHNRVTVEKDTSQSSITTDVTPEASGNVEKSLEDLSLSEAKSSSSVNALEEGQEVDGTVEDTHKSMTSDTIEISKNVLPSIAQGNVTVSAISPEEMHFHVFVLINDEMEVEASFLAASIIQYMQSAVTEKLKVPAEIQVLLIDLLAREKRYGEIMHFVRTKVVDPSKEVAKQLLQIGKSYHPIFMLGLNMLRQLSFHGEYLSEILQQGRLLEALRYARQNRVEAVPPSTFLELAAASHDRQKLACVMRFCLDFVPSFETTSEYQTYSAVLNQQKLVLA